MTTRTLSEHWAAVPLPSSARRTLRANGRLPPRKLGVVRNASGTGGVVGAASELLAAKGDADFADGILMSHMVGGLRELIVGMHVDPQFGSCVMAGAGGVLAEAFADVQFALLPVSPEEVFEMLSSLGAQSLFGQVRGEPPIDRQALVDVVIALSTVAEREPDVTSIDINPLKIWRGKPVAVDALVQIRSNEARVT